MKKKRWIPILIPCLWCLLVLLLTLAEQQSSAASIKTGGDALWYSLVTLTTVGYGDLFPVTFWGKIIGGIFVLLSIGLAAMIFGFIVVLLTGHAIPKMQLLLPRKKPYIYCSLLTAMIAGRLVWGAAMFLCMNATGGSFPFAAFLAGAVTNAIPGIILHIVLIPVIVFALQKALPWLNTHK